MDSLEDLLAVARGIWTDLGKHRVFLLSGGLGAGKTTLVQAICEHLGVVEEVVSPTYTIINEYRDGNGEPVYHADLYRLNSLQEAYETGIEDCLFSSYPCFVEWPELIDPILPSKFVKLAIERTPSGGRNVIAEIHG
jgi:tRNA threonylcarbamoyladenosine biosynthesis protein TsaE